MSDVASEAEVARLFDGLTIADGGRARAARTRGQVFTPAALAAAVAELGLALVRRPARALDPACGDGALLAAVSARAPQAVLVGIERDPTVARRARRRLPGARIVCRDALDGDLAVAAELLVGNPPFVRSIRLRADDPDGWRALRGRFAATSFGEWDVYGAFLERTLDWLAPGGAAVWIVPSRWLMARWAGPLRAHLAARGAVRQVIDLGARQLFAAATTYASIVVMGTGGGPRPMRLTRHDGQAWRGVDLDVATLGAAPWIEPAPGGGRAARRQGADAATLGAVARIAKGVGTNADRVFVLPDAMVRGRWVEFAGGAIEAALTRPCLRGRDVGAAPRARCLVPYQDGELIPWRELSRRYPRAAAYLEAHRALLEAREGGRFVGDRFHAFGRPQNLAFLLDPSAKLVIPDVARAPRVWRDDTGALPLDSAYALRPRVDAPPPWRDLDRLAALFTDGTVAAWLARASVPLRGDYRRMKTAILAPMPLPR